MIVYKYVKPERREDLRTGLIRFTQADALNDPFEVNPSFSEFISGGIEYAKAQVKYTPTDLEIQAFAQEEAGRFRQMLIPEYLMLSLSRTNNNPLMWSHYASCHYGFVIGFDANHPFFIDAQSLKSKLLPVEYSGTRYVLPRMEDWTRENTLPVFLRKSTDWAYEQELRMFMPARNASEQHQDPHGVPIYLLKFPGESLAQIVFGLFVQKDVKDETIELLNEFYPHVEVFQAAMNDTNFDLDIVPIR
jgi:hypothetical protein